MNNQRIPPNDSNAEQAVLGAILLSETALRKCMETISESDFYYKDNAEIFKACASLYAEAKPVDLVTVIEELKKNHTLELVGGISQVATYSANVPTTSNAVAYALIVKEKAMMRKLIEASWVIAEQCFSGREKGEDILRGAEDAVLAISKEQAKGQEETPEPSKLAAIFKANLEKEVTQIKTPFSWLNDMTSGLVPGNLFTIAGRTSAGKSAFVLQMAKHIADTRKVVYISLEMPPVELVARYVASETNIAQRDLMLHKLKFIDQDALDRSLKRYAGSKLYFSSDGRDTAAIERMVKSAKPDLLIVDTVNLVQSKGESERVKILNVTRELKQLALKADIPIIILAQLNRSADTKTTPTLADIKESASIEEDSDVVLLLTEISNGEKFDSIADGIGIDELEFADMKGRGERLIFALIQKNRNGNLGRATFRFEGRKFTFTEIGAAEKPVQTELWQTPDEDDLPF
jgi:replicative DNA helicase